MKDIRNSYSDLLRIQVVVVRYFTDDIISQWWAVHYANRTKRFPECRKRHSAAQIILIILADIWAPPRVSQPPLIPPTHRILAGPPYASFQELIDDLNAWGKTSGVRFAKLRSINKYKGYR